MSDLPYWVDIDFSTDHQIVQGDGNPSFHSGYLDGYFSGPYPTLADAKQHIRFVTRLHREAISDKLNYWMERTVSDIALVKEESDDS